MTDPLEAARPKHPPLRELVHSMLLTVAEHDFICAARSSGNQLLVWDRRDGTDRQLAETNARTEYAVAEKTDGYICGVYSTMQHAQTIIDDLPDGCGEPYVVMVREVIQTTWVPLYRLEPQ